MTIRISWSSLRTHEECKQKAHLQSKGMRSSLEDIRVFFPGTVTDRVVRDWLMDDPKNSPGAMVDMVDIIMEREEEATRQGKGVINWKSSTDRDDVRAECIRAVTEIEPVLEELVLPHEYTADYRFKTPIDLPHPDGGYGQVILNGAIDILVKTKFDEYFVWDVKHTKDKDYWRKTEGQLTFYDTAVSLIFGKNTTMSGLLQPLLSEQVRGFHITEDKRQQMNQRLMAMASDIWSEVHDPRDDNKYCGYCAVKHACVKFRPVEDGQGNRRVSGEW